MSEKMLDNNQVVLVGTVHSKPIYSHEAFGERFYLFELATGRTSGAVDIIPIIISERIMGELVIIERVKITGQFRSFNQQVNNRSKLLLSVFVREIEATEEPDANYISIDGFLCRKPAYRKTPLGREISDMLVAVNRPYGKSDYIPCLCWGRNARYVAGLSIGARINVNGRIQSREYQKRISETETETRTAFEMSINWMEHIDGGRDES